MQPPHVSVVLIFLDEAPFLDEAVASVYAQTYADWEIVLVDDGSSDGSSAIARRYAEGDPGRVRYLEHPGHANRGQGAARNLGAAAARGEWIAFLDGDDVWLPNRLERGVALALAHPDAPIVYGRTEYWQSWSAAARAAEDHVQPHYFSANRIVRAPELLARHLALTAAYPCMGSLLLKRRTFEAVGGFDESFGRIGEDLVFFGKLCLQYPVYVSDECWDRYRQHPHSTTAAAGEEDIRGAHRAYLAWLEKYFREQGVVNKRLDRALHAAMRRADRAPGDWRSRLERMRRRAMLWREVASER